MILNDTNTFKAIQEGLCLIIIDKSVTLFYLNIISNDNEKDTDNSTDTDRLRSKRRNSSYYHSIYSGICSYSSRRS